MTEKRPVIAIKGLTTRFGDNVVHQDLSLEVQRGEIVAIVGGSGSGKTTLLREILMLQQPYAGTISIFGQEITGSQPINRDSIRRRWGVMFQSGALFSELTVLENISFGLREFTSLPKAMINEIAMLKLQLASLPPEAANLYPSELSGGMIKRASVARAIAMDPELLFLDEPTAGLDPESAGEFDELVLQLRANLGLTVVIITHDIDTLWKVPDRVAFLGRKQVLAVEPVKELTKNPDPIIQEYFNSPRARAAVPVAAGGE
jgi:phospholipid/cholesterol/gamma-HCH transport system ATP-binding protein